MESQDYSVTSAGATGPRRAESLRQETISLLRRFNIRARKDLGQNFLIDSEVLDRVIAAADLQPTDVALEVGPGLGVLTRELARRCRRVVAVEVDARMVNALHHTLAGFSNIAIVERDILETEPVLLLSEALGEEPDRVRLESYKVVANLPYYLTSMAIRHFLEASLKPRLIVLTLQKEVAERIVARPGRLSLLAISVQVYGKADLIAIVPASSFLPQPKVDSAIVRIDVFDRPAVDVDDIDAFFQVVQAGFSQPRKQLHNAIAQRIWLPAGKAQDLLGAAGIDPRRRAETLTLEEWGRFYEILQKFRKENR